MNNNYTISNSSVGTANGLPSKSTRYYGLPQQQQQQQYQSASPSNDQSRPSHGKVQVLKPIINYKHNANKVIGIDMSQEEYFFYKPILGGRKQAASNGGFGRGDVGTNENRDPQININNQQSVGAQAEVSHQYGSKLKKKYSTNTSSNQGTHSHNSHTNSISSKDFPISNSSQQQQYGTKFLMHQLNSNHLMSPKPVISTSGLMSNQKNLSSNNNSVQADNGSIPSQKKSQIQNYSSNSQPLTQRYIGDENIKSDNYQSSIHYRPKLSTIEDSSILDFKQISHLTPSNATARQHILDQGRLSTGRISLSRDHHQSQNQYNHNNGIRERESNVAADISNDPSSVHVTKNSLIGFENNKQYSNNPLKDISNSTVINAINYSKQPKTNQASSGNTTSRHSMPFSIAPSSIKFNNYIDQPFKQITPSVKSQNYYEKDNMPFTVSNSTKHAAGGSGATVSSHGSQYNKQQSNGQINYEISKISNFEDQHRFSSKMHHQISTTMLPSTFQSNYSSNQATQKPQNSYFEKKRLSGGEENSNIATTSLNYRDRMEEDAMLKEIFEKKEKQRKGHNASVTTNTSTASNNNPVRKTLTQYGQFGGHNGTQNSSLQNSAIRKSQGAKAHSHQHSKQHNNTTTTNINDTTQGSASIISLQSTNQNQTPSNQQSSLQASIAALKILEQHDQQLTAIMEGVKRKTKPQFSLKESAKSIKELNRNIKTATSGNDSTLTFLLRQHTRTHYIALAFVRGLQDDLMGLAKSTDNLQAIILNALEYVKKNFKCLNDILLAQSISQNSKQAQQSSQNTSKHSKKDLNSNPFGVVGGGAVTTRNNSNKENYGQGNSGTTKNLAAAAASSSSKSEKKMFIKQNVQISLAFLKKICRLQKAYQERFKEFLLILSQIESGAGHAIKIKEQIKRALHQIRIEMKQQQNNHNSATSLNLSNNNSPNRKSLSRTQRKGQRRESMTIEIDENTTSSINRNSDLTSDNNLNSTASLTLTINNFAQAAQQHQNSKQKQQSNEKTDKQRQQFTSTLTNFHFTSQFGECKEQEHEESTEENKSSSRSNNLSAQKMDTDPFLPGDLCEEDIQRGNKNLRDSPQEKSSYNRLFVNKENAHPNIFEKPGRYSLQPQPIGGLKMNEPIQPYRPDKPVIKVESVNIQQQAEKENLRPTQQTRENIAANSSQRDLQSQNQQILQQKDQQSQQVQQPQLSIVTKRHGNKISNTHEPITVRGQRPNLHKLNEDTNGLQYCIAPAHINQRSSSQPSKEPYLPRDVTRGLEYTLVLDLDETLVHFDPKIRTYRPRPHCLKFLHEMSKYYELVVFTAGLKDYADWILNDLDRSGYISYRLYRDHTKCRHGIYIKDLSKLGRDLTKTIIVDNIEENFQAQPDNGIPIKSWYHDQGDRELEKYANFLRDIALRRIQDVRPDVKQFKQQLNQKYLTIEDGRSPIKYHKPGHEDLRKAAATTTHSTIDYPAQTAITNNNNPRQQIQEKPQKLSLWGVR